MESEIITHLRFRNEPYKCEGKLSSSKKVGKKATRENGNLGSNECPNNFCTLIISIKVFRSFSNR